jgi:putative transposase
MSCSIVLRPEDRNALLATYRRDPDPESRRRAHIVLLLAAGHPWTTIALVLFTSSSTIARWQARYQQGGLAALRGERPGRRRFLGSSWVEVVARWVTALTPRTFGWLRSRWTCALVAAALLELHGVAVSRETVRRGLHQAGLVWRRPRPVLRPKDPQRSAKLRALRRLLAELPRDEVAVFEDEVDVNTNPKIGSMWMRKGDQAAVETPGTNEKRYLAGSVSWRTGSVVVTEGTRRDGQLFVEHLDELRRRLRCYRVIHVICDNARFHVAARCKKVQAYLQRWGHRIRLHYLPTYAPETNPIERLWWHLHDEVTRNHSCQSLDELLELTFEWLEGRNPFRIEGSVYPQADAA